MKVGKLFARVLIVAGALFWARMALQMEFRGMLPSEAQAGRLSIAALGCLIAWGVWRKLDRAAEAASRARQRDRELAEATPWSARSANELAMGTRVDMGPCPRCGGGPFTVLPTAGGQASLRCRECGVVLDAER